MSIINMLSCGSGQILPSIHWAWFKLAHMHTGINSEWTESSCGLWISLGRAMDGDRNGRRRNENLGRGRRGGRGGLNQSSSNLFSLPIFASVDHVDHNWVDFWFDLLLLDLVHIALLLVVAVRHLWGRRQLLSRQ